MQWKTLTRVLALLVGTAIAGCFTVVDDEGPIMSIELFWDARPNTDDFFGGTCNQADVDWMDWTLYRLETGPDGETEAVKVAEGSEPCADAIDVIEPKPGEYFLDIVGLNEDDEPIWQARCPACVLGDEEACDGQEEQSLVVLRFDVAYACEIEAPIEL